MSNPNYHFDNDANVVEGPDGDIMSNPGDVKPFPGPRVEAELRYDHPFDAVPVGGLVVSPEVKIDKVIESEKPRFGLRESTADPHHRLDVPTRILGLQRVREIQEDIQSRAKKIDTDS